MNAVNAVQLFFLVSTAVCQVGDDVISVSCEDVTGTVGEEVTLSCSVSQCSKCCIKNYKFQYSEVDTETEICKEEFPDDSCEQRNSFTCRFTPTTAMTRQFRLFVQTERGTNITGITVSITEPSKPEPDTPNLSFCQEISFIRFSAAEVFCEESDCLQKLSLWVNQSH